MSGQYLLTAALVAYMTGAVALGAHLFLRRDALLWTGRAGAIIGLVLHTLAIGVRCWLLKQAPFATPSESLSLLAYLLAGLYLLVDVFAKLPQVGAFALGLSFLALLVGETVGRSVVAPPLLSERAISLHITATLAAFAAFALAFGCAALYLVVHRILKTRHGLAWLKRLPPLSAVESTAFMMVAVGFPLLTLGILSGFVRALGGGMNHSAWQTDPKTLLSYAVWIVYAAYLFLRTRAQWPPIRLFTTLIIGAILCALLFVVPTDAHRFP